MKKLSKNFIGSVLHAPASSFIDVWTIKDQDVFDTMIVDNYITAEWNHEESFQNNIDREEDAKAYTWLKAQLPEKINNWSGEAPVWCWLRKLNIREYMREKWDKPYPEWCIIHARVPRKRMVLSCYDLWHAPLNDFAIYPEVDDDYNYPGKPEETWHHIFDVEYKHAWYKHYGARGIVQACVDRIYLHEIVSCARIHGRSLRPMEMPL